LDATFLGKFRYELKHNSELGDRIRQRRELMETCKLSEIQSITQELYECTFKTIAVNSGGWSIYVTPFLLIAVTVIAMIGLFNKCKMYTRKFMSAIVFLPERTVTYAPRDYYIQHQSAEI